MNNNTNVEALTINNQPKMSFSRTLFTTVISIRYRLFRSIVTVGVITVAVAFLMNMLTESVLKRSVVATTTDEITGFRQAATWIARLSVLESIEETMLRIASIKSTTDSSYLESQQMSNFTDSEMKTYYTDVKEAVSYMKMFDGLEYVHKRKLVGMVSGTGVFDYLQNKENMDNFTANLNKLKFISIYGSKEKLVIFVSRWDEIKKQTARMQGSYNNAIKKIVSTINDKSAAESLCDANGEFGEIIRKAGFIFDKQAGKDVAMQSTRIIRFNFLEKSIINPVVRQPVAAYLNILPGDVEVETMWNLLSKKETAKWYLSLLEEKKLNQYNLTANELYNLTFTRKKEDLLARIDRIVGGDTGGGLLGIGERMSWLILLSLIVCIVGISNAMLMSVTERFREIAILKCLGALDGFIMLMFVLEASILGLFGGITGSVVGILIGTGRMMSNLGSIVMMNYPVLQLGIFMLVSTAVGIILASFASIYPSIIAARLAPMEAMRIE